MLLIFILSIGAVCAADNICDDTLSDNNQETLELSQNDVISDESIEILETPKDSVNEIDDTDLLAIEDGKSNNNPKNEPLSYTINEDISLSENDNAITSTPDESLESNTESYGFVVFGSNVISLNIYDVKDGEIISKQIFNEPSPTASYTVDGNLSQAGIKNLISILEGFNNILDSKSIDSRYVFATASMRKINNPDEVISIIKDRLGITIEVISGDDEAEIGFNVTKDTDLTVDEGLLINLGGGSCEVTHFKDKSIVNSDSMPIGSNSLYKSYVSILLPNETEAESIENNVTAELNQLSIGESASFEHLFGTGGTIYTIKLMLIYLNMIDEDTMSIPRSKLDELYDVLKENKKETYQTIISVDADRIHTLVPGLICTKTILEYFNVQYLHFCKSTFEDGILTKVIERENSKEIPKLNVNKINTTSDEDIEISVKLPTDAQGTVSIELNNAIYKALVKNGLVLINTPKLKAGDYIAKIAYSGDEKYKSINENLNIHVRSAKIDASNINRGWNSNYDYQVKLLDENGNAIKGKLVTFTIGKKQYYAKTNSNGVASIKVKLNVGTYKVTVSTPLMDKNVTKTLKIIKRIQNNKNLNTYYNSNAKIRIKIIGDNGKAETKGKAVKVTIGKKQYTFKTNKNGYITIPINKTLKVGKYTVKIQYKGYSVQNKITVKHNLASKKIVNIKKTAKSFVLKAQLKANYKNKKIKFRFRGKTYSTKTNSKGIAKVTIKRAVIKKLKKGKTYSVKITYLNENLKTSVKVK